MAEEPKRKSKAEILKHLKGDIASADQLRLEAVAKRNVWRREYNGELYGNEVDGKSKLVSRDIKRQDEWQHASIKDPFVSDQDIIKCNPITFEDKASANQNELILNYQFTRQFKRYKFMTDVIKLFYSEGTVIVKTGWDYEDEVVKVEVPTFGVDPFTGQEVQIGTEIVDQINVLVNKPDAKICRLEDVYLDPTAEGDQSKAQFTGYRYETDLSTLKKSRKYKNLNKVAMKVATDMGHTIPGAGDDFDPTDDTYFYFKDVARKKLLIYEYYGNYDVKGIGIATPIAAAWIDDILIQLEDNPFPDKEIPFIVLANNSIPFKQHGEGNAELIGDNQKLSTAIKRGIMDNMANSNNGQKGIKNGALDSRNTKRFLNDKNFIFNGSSADFYEGSYNAIPNTVFNVLEMINSDSESMLGVKSFSNGIEGNSLGGTATAARGALDAVSVRRLDIVRNIAENLIKVIMRKWMAYNSEFLRPEEVIRVTNDEFVPIKRDDLKGNIDINIHVSTAEDNSAKSERLAFMLQTGQQTMDPGEVRIIRAEMARLDKMPDLAKKIEEFQPQPDPMQVEIQQLQIEKLKAEINERNTRAAENQVDMQLKQANTLLAQAKARELGASSDMKDLDFTRKADGREFEEKMVEKNFDRETLAGLKNIDRLTKQ